MEPNGDTSVPALLSPIPWHSAKGLMPKGEGDPVLELAWRDPHFDPTEVSKVQNPGPLQQLIVSYWCGTAVLGGDCRHRSCTEARGQVADPQSSGLSPGRPSEH